MVKTYRKKPIEVRALQYDGENYADIVAFVGNNGTRKNVGTLVYTPEGWVPFVKGDYIIRGVAGEYYPCKPDIFAKTYDEVE